MAAKSCSAAVLPLVAGVWAVAASPIGADAVSLTLGGAASATGLPSTGALLPDVLSMTTGSADDADEPAGGAEAQAEASAANSTTVLTRNRFIPVPWG